MNRHATTVTPHQVEALLRGAGIEPCAPPADIATTLSAQLSAVAPAFARIRFWADATAFLAALETAQDKCP